ncbi:MAG: BrnT family toxin [candidate division NC10 bacterium]|nr:BrnT family toxin [candidate division NC10 bacterium]
MTLGLLRGNVVSIVHTEEDDHIHVISMRKATKREREIYFQSIAN